MFSFGDLGYISNIVTGEFFNLNEPKDLSADWVKISRSGAQH
jgi:hypothetical protein